jgi:hypothetical protein
MNPAIRSLAIALLIVWVAAAARAGPALFSASFIMHAFGNDVSSGTAYPFNTSFFTAQPIGYFCPAETPNTINGPNPNYCGRTILQRGRPATGIGEVVVGPGSPASIALPPSAFGITTTGFLPDYYPYLQSWTYATFVNATGAFSAGGGPAAGQGARIHSGMGMRQGSWIIREGKNGFGGAMGLLGRFGLRDKYVITGKVGTYEGTMSRNMIPALGRLQYATPIGVTAMGKVSAWQNPYVNTGMFENNLNGNISTIQARGTGTSWTTGSVTVYATAGLFTTILHRKGFDTTAMNTTPMGTATVRNLQLVTPALTHWIGPGSQDHTGHIGILKLQVPEPAEMALITAGLASLVLLRRVGRRR